MSTLKVDAIVDSSAGNTTTINGTTPTAYNTMGKNRIINGAMEIDQRSAGASTTVTGNSYVTCDRWHSWSSVSSKFSIEQSTTAPTGFNYSLLATSLSTYSPSSSDYFLISQKVEGYNFADMAWGTANAKTVTLSFWVRSSLTGTFGGGFDNAAGNRSYPFTYTINSADTWEQKTITIAGDTTGTWVGATNGNGLSLWFGLGCGTTRQGTPNTWQAGNYPMPTGMTQVVGTSGATLYITGVQLEAGSVATEFERRPYGIELQLCQRYYFVLAPKATLQPTGVASYYNNTYLATNVSFPTTMRSSPTVVSASGTDYFIAYRAGSSDTFNSWTRDSGAVNQQMVEIYNNTEISGTGGQVATTRTNNASAFVHFNAEL